MMKYSVAFSLLLALSFSACVSEPAAPSPDLNVNVTPPPSEYELVRLDASDPVCSSEPALEMNAMTGAQEIIFPVYAEYSRGQDDRYQLMGLFTAAACGEGRVEALFGDQTWSDYLVHVSPEGGRDLQLEKTMDDLGFERLNDGDDATARFWHEGSIDAESLLKLRSFAPFILGSDCTLCG